MAAVKTIVRKRKNAAILIALIAAVGLLATAAIITAAQSSPLHLSGTVVDASGPVAGAIVRVQATTLLTTTDAAGQFTLILPADTAPVYLTAWRPGSFITGTEEPLTTSTAGITLTLTAHHTQDNADYAFISPTQDMSDPNACAHCHTSQTEGLTLPVDEWLLDAHAGAATNPRFLSLYNGTTLDGDQPGALTQYAFDTASGVDVFVAPSLGMDDVGPGFRLDYPDSGGNCAACHVPVAALDAPYDADPNLAAGVAAEGVTCDFCHKVSDVRLTASGLPDDSLPGVLSMQFLRPPEDAQIFIGPLDDTPGDDVFSPLQNESEFCAACHFGEFWGVTMYNSFGEWLESPYSDPDTGQTCQDCHMPHTGATIFAQLPADDPHHVPERDPETIFGHRMPGAEDLDLLQNTADVAIDAVQDSGELVVTVRVTNSGAGHHIPTDNPLRNMILLVSVADANGEPLPLLDGPTIPAWGGVGDPADGYYAGQPGVLYAKILADYFTGETPTYAYWRQTVLVSDNRIPALETDETVYRFALPPDNAAITVDAQLFLRRAFIELMDVKNWDTPDILMEHETLEVAP